MEPLPAVLIAGTILVLCAYALDMQGFPVLCFIYARFGQQSNLY